MVLLNEYLYHFNKTSNASLIRSLIHAMLNKQIDKISSPLVRSKLRRTLISLGSQFEVSVPSGGEGMEEFMAVGVCG